MTETTTNMTRSPVFQELPGPNDLLILPKSLEPSADVFLKEGVIAIVSSNPQLHLDKFSMYPHLEPRLDADGHVLLVPTERHQIRLVLVSWPGGEQLGLLLWQDNYYSVVSPDSLAEMAAAGVPAAAWEAGRSDDLVSVVARHLCMS
jgi:hypothetical protein